MNGKRVVAVVALIALSCAEPAAKVRPVGDAVRSADSLVLRAYSAAEYRQTCATRMNDGYLLTYRFVPVRGMPSDAVLGLPSFVRVAVPDRGIAIERHLTVESTREPFVHESGARPPRDSASTVIAAPRAMTDAAGVHCVLPLLGGAWVEFLSTTRVSVAAASGTVVAVNGTGAARIIARF